MKTEMLRECINLASATGPVTKAAVEVASAELAAIEAENAALKAAIAVKDEALRQLVLSADDLRQRCGQDDPDVITVRLDIEDARSALSSTPPSGMVDSRDEVVKALIEGLTTDGGHHKQWALEKAFRALCQDDYVDEAQAEFCWDEGIAP